MAYFGNINNRLTLSAGESLRFNGVDFESFVPLDNSSLNAYIPYSGATGNVDLGSYELIAGTITINGSILSTNTYVSTTNFEQLRIRPNNTQYEISSIVGSTGGNNRPIQIGHTNAAGTFTSAIVVGADNIVSITGGIISSPATGIYLGRQGQAYNLYVHSSGASGRVALPQNSLLGWSSSADPSSSVTTTLSQQSAGVVQIGTTAANALGSVICETITGNSVVNTPLIQNTSFLKVDLATGSEITLSVYGNQYRFGDSVAGFRTMGKTINSGLITATGISLQNGTTATQLDIHNTYTSATNREFLCLKPTASVIQIGSAVGSAGGSNRNLILGHFNAAGTFTDALSIATDSTISIGGLTINPANGSTTFSQTFAMSFSSSNEIAIRHGNNDLVKVRPVSLSGTYTPAGYGALAFANTSNAIGVYLVPTSAGTLAVRTAAHGDAALNCGAITTSGDMRVGTSTEYVSIGSSSSSVISAYSNALGFHYVLIGDTTGSGGPMCFRIGSGGTLEWRSTTRSDTGTTDLAFGRDAANVLGIYTDSTKANKADITIRSITANGSMLLSSTSGSYQIFNSAMQLTKNGSSLLLENQNSSHPLDLSSNGPINIVSAQGLTAYLGFSTTRANINPDVRLYRDAANILGLQNSTNAQTFRVYNTFTSSTNNEFLQIRGVGSANFEIGPQNGSGGGTLRGLTIGSYDNGSSTITPWLSFDSNGYTYFHKNINMNDRLVDNIYSLSNSSQMLINSPEIAFENSNIWFRNNKIYGYTQVSQPFTLYLVGKTYDENDDEFISVKATETGNFELGVGHNSVGSSVSRGLTIGSYSSSISGSITPWLSFNTSGTATFSGNISAANLSGTNTGDQDLSGYASLSGSYTNPTWITSLAFSKISGITGTPNGSKFLRDDGSWQTISGGGPISWEDLAGTLSSGWNTSNDTVSKDLDVSTITLTQLANVVATLIDTLKGYGLIE